jgi:hypothetical protein
MRDVTGAVDGQLRFGSPPPLNGDLEPLGRIVATCERSNPATSGGRWRHPPAIRPAAPTKPSCGALRASWSRAATWSRGRAVSECWSRIPVGPCGSWPAIARRRFRGSLIAVAGSLGKRTTQHLIRTVLQQRYEGLASDDDLPPRVAVPLMLSMLKATHDFGMVAYSSRKKGEIQAISHLCSPDLAVINCLTIERRSRRRRGNGRIRGRTGPPGVPRRLCGAQWRRSPLGAVGR